MSGGLDSAISQLQMYIPAFVVLILYWVYLKKPVFRTGDLGLNLHGLKYWLIGPAFMSALSILSYAISYLLNPDMFEARDSIVSGLESKGLYFGNMFLGLTAVLLINGIVGAILNIPMFLGEELGWRGFLTPRLFHICKPMVAFLISGFFWGIWHAGMIMMGLNYPSVNPILGVCYMIALCIPLGIITQYFYFKSRSIIVAALTHAALNKSAMTASFVLKDQGYDTTLYGPTGLVGIAVFSLTAAVLYFRIDWRKANPYTVSQQCCKLNA